MKQNRLIEETAKRADESRALVKKIMKSLAASLLTVLQADGEVNIPGIGIWRVKPTKPRIGRNPKTGVTVQIPPSKKISYKPSSRLKRSIRH